ncbi:hypothetical protein KP509_01G113000 [Ceratopteris richardii]|nr:hypothetical protein KP509_01G113000 [Ceratopteris richardii]
MLKSLVDSMQLELNDCPAVMLSSARVPKASFILGLAHVFLALVCKLMKNTTNLVAFHLLEAFVVSPKDARQSFIPELWTQLFAPHLSAVDTWYKKEYASIVNNFSRSSSILPDSKAVSPPKATAMNAIVPRANSLMDLVTGMGLGRRGTSSQGNTRKAQQNKQDQTKILERMNMQVKLLSNLYDQSLDEGTIQFARHYQDLVVSYYERFSYDQVSRIWKGLQNTVDDTLQQHKTTAYQIDKEVDTFGVPMPKSFTKIGYNNNRDEDYFNNDDKNDDDDDDENDDDDNDYNSVDGKLISGGWTGANGLQFRRSLFEAIFGALHIDKSCKKDRTYGTIPSNHLSSLLHLCSKKMPAVIDPLRTKTSDQVEKDAHMQASTNESNVENKCATAKTTTIRDVVNTAFSPLPRDLPTLSIPTTGRKAASSPILSAESGNPTAKLKRSGSMSNSFSTELLANYNDSNHLDITSKQESLLATGTHSRKLVDFIKFKNHQSDIQPSLAMANKVPNQTSGFHQTNILIAGSSDGTKVEQKWIKASSSPNDKEENQISEQATRHRETTKMTSNSQSPRKDSTQVDDRKPETVQDQIMEEVQVKYCTSLQVQRDNSPNAYTPKVQLMERINVENASHRSCDPEVDVKKHVSTTREKPIGNQLEEVATKMKAVVSAAQSSNNAPEDVGRCEEALLQLSQSWLECKTATLLQKKGAANKNASSVTDNSDAYNILYSLTHELLYILANSELQEAQRLALCLLSASINSRRLSLNNSTTLQQNIHAENKGECRKSDRNHLQSDPLVLHALTHLLEQQDRLPEAALLLHLLHPAQYSSSCQQFLHHLLPLLLDLAQRGMMPIPKNVPDHNAISCTKSLYGDHHLIWESLKPRALALLMMSQLLAAVDKDTRLQACKHVLFPNVNGLPCFLHSLDCAQSIDEKIAAAFILTTCMQADDISRQHIVKHVKLPCVVALLQQSASNGSAFQTVVNLVTELLRARKSSIADLLNCVRQDGLLNCMHALMAYLQTTSLENRPPAAGLLLQLDLLLGDDRYSVFREEALEALLSPLLKDNNREATFIAVHILSTIGCSDSEQELEAWVLKKAGLAAADQEEVPNQRNQHSVTQTQPAASMVENQGEKKGNTKVGEWDARVARALIGKGGDLVSNALAKGLQSKIAEVRKTCLLVTAWLTFHLGSVHPSDHRHRATSGRCAFSRDQCNKSAKVRMRDSLQEKLREVAAADSGSVIMDRVLAAFALRNLT